MNYNIYRSNYITRLGLIDKFNKKHPSGISDYDLDYATKTMQKYTPENAKYWREQLKNNKNAYALSRGSGYSLLGDKYYHNTNVKILNLANEYPEILQPFVNSLDPNRVRDKDEGIKLSNYHYDLRNLVNKTPDSVHSVKLKHIGNNLDVPVNTIEDALMYQPGHILDVADPDTGITHSLKHIKSIDKLPDKKLRLNLGDYEGTQFIPRSNDSTHTDMNAPWSFNSTPIKVKNQYDQKLHNYYLAGYHTGQLEHAEYVNDPEKRKDKVPKAMIPIEKYFYSKGLNDRLENKPFGSSINGLKNNYTQNELRTLFVNERSHLITDEMDKVLSGSAIPKLRQDFIFRNYLIHFVSDMWSKYLKDNPDDTNLSKFSQKLLENLFDASHSFKDLITKLRGTVGSTHGPLGHLTSPNAIHKIEMEWLHRHRFNINHKVIPSAPGEQVTEI